MGKDLQSNIWINKSKKPEQAATSKAVEHTKIIGSGRSVDRSIRLQNDKERLSEKNKPWPDLMIRSLFWNKEKIGECISKMVKCLHYGVKELHWYIHKDWNEPEMHT